MIHNFLRRLLSGLLILFLFQTVMFFIVQIILPGDLVSVWPSLRLRVNLKNYAKHYQEMKGSAIPIRCYFTSHLTVFKNCEWSGMQCSCILYEVKGEEHFRERPSTS